MKRSELGAVLVAAVVAGALGLVLALFAASLAGSSVFNVGSNLIQYTSGPATIGAVAMAAWLRWHRRCGVPLCVRIGEHPVDGTSRKVCVHHHTRAHHELVHDLHGEFHRLEGRLGWGESHGRPKPGHTSRRRADPPPPPAPPRPKKPERRETPKKEKKP